MKDDDTETAEEAEADKKSQQLGEMVERNLIKFARRQIDENGLEPWIMMVAMLRTTAYLGQFYLTTEETEKLFRTSADDLDEFLRKRMN